MKVLQSCGCGCTRRIVQKEDGIYLEDSLVGISEKITVYDDDEFINSKWTFYNLKGNIKEIIYKQVTTL